MDIGFDRINQQLEDIVNEFNDLLTQGKYDEAKTAVEDIAAILNDDTTPNIDISTNTTYDNNFHKLYSKFEEITNAITSPAAQAAGNTTDFNALKQCLENIASQIFKTHEVRNALITKNDPDMDEYKRALEEGINETNARKTSLEQQKEMYRALENTLFFDDSVTPPVDIRIDMAKTKSFYDKIKDVEAALNEVDSEYTWINDPANAGSPDLPTHQTNLDNKKTEIKTLIEAMGNDGYDIVTAFGNLDDFVKETNIANSLATANGEKVDIEIDLEDQYTKVKDKIDYVKAGNVSFTDSNGNVVNLQDMEIIRNFDTTVIDFVSNFDDSITKIDDLSSQIVARPGQIDNELLLCDQEVEIFRDHVRVIEFENQQLARNVNDRQMYLNEMDATTRQAMTQEINDRTADVKDKYMGNAQKHKEYKAAWKRFQAHRVALTETFTDSRGHTFNFTYDTIPDTGYPEKDDDIKLMQLESWEVRSRRVALANAINNNRNLSDNDKTRALAEVYGNNRYIELENRLVAAINGGAPYTPGNPADPAAIAEMRKELVEMSARLSAQVTRDNDYVKNYNSAHFDVRDTVAIALTGGSAMRARTNQSKGKMTIGEGLAAFFGVTPYNVKADGKVHPVRTTISNIFGIISTPVRAMRVAIGVTIGGVTAAIGKLTGTYDMPTPYKVGYLDRREARLEYYRNNGSTRIGAWFKSLFNLKAKDENGNVRPGPNGEALTVNDYLINQKCLTVAESVEDTYIRGAREKLIDAQIQAERNRRARVNAYQNQLRSAEMYEDIYMNDPEALSGNVAEQEAMRKRAMQRSSLNIGGVNQGPIPNIDQSFVTDGKERKGRFKQTDPTRPINGFNFNVDNNLDYSQRIGEAIWTNPISRENMQRARTRGMDAAIRIVGAATIPAFKGFLSKFVIKAFKKPNEFVPPRIITENQDIVTHGKRPVMGMKEMQYTDTHVEDVSVDNLTFGDIHRGDKAFWSADLDNYSGPHAHGMFSDAATEIQGAHIKFVDPLTNQSYDFSFSPTSYKNYIDHHNLNPFSTEYHDNISFNAGDNVVDSLVKHMPKEMGDAYERFLDEASKSGNFAEAFSDSTHFAYGVPTQASEAMGQGWSETIVDAITKEVSETKTKYVRGIVGYEDYEITVTKPVQKVIEGYVKEGSYVAVPGGYIVGAASMLAADLKQAMSPVFRKGQRNAKNFHGANGTEIGKSGYEGTAYRDSDLNAMYDMYESALDENNNPYRYDSAKSRNDPALNATKHDGTPIGLTDQNGNPAHRDPYDDDDFVL